MLGFVRLKSPKNYTFLYLYSDTLSFVINIDPLASLMSYHRKKGKIKTAIPDKGQPLIINLTYWLH